MNNNHLARNASMSVAQVLVSGGVLFLLYRYLLQTVGSEKLGVWAVVLATASVSRISEMGFNGSAVKFTAKYMARGEIEKAAQVVQTTILTIGFFLGCVLVAGYPIIGGLMQWFVPTAYKLTSLSVLPYALISVWIGSIAGVSLSGLDGCQRVDLRAFIVILSGVAFLCLTWALVPRLGLLGLAWAQIAQSTLMLIASWALLRREIHALNVVPTNWRFELFREMFSYGVNFQVISIASLLFEPTTKALMAKFGGLTLTAYYEMASRLVVQCRALLVSANQVIVPQVAVRQEISPKEIDRVYRDTYEVVFFLALPLYAALAAAVPLISILWLGHYEHIFVVYTLLLMVGFAFNTLVGPAYFVNLGTGSLRWNTIAHVAIGILNAGLGFLLGKPFGDMGVVVGFVLALVIGSSLVVIGHHRDNRIPFSILWPVESRKLFLACVVGLLAGTVILLISPLPGGGFTGASLSLATCILVIVPAIWNHSMRTTLYRRVN